MQKSVGISCVILSIVFLINIASAADFGWCGDAYLGTFDSEQAVRSAGPCVDGNTIKNNQIILNQDQWQWTCVGSSGSEEDCWAYYGETAIGKVAGEINLLGSGTETNPYKIYNCKDLNSVRYNPKAYFKLMNDIDCSSMPNFAPITPYGEFNLFEGVFDGKGKAIKNLNLFGSQNPVGLFGQIGRNGVVKNLRIVGLNVNISQWMDRSSIKYHNAGTGALAGLNKGKIQSCTVEDSKIIGNRFVGGMVGINEGSIKDSFVKNSYVEGITTIPQLVSMYIGGFVGINQEGRDSNGRIFTSYAQAEVRGSTDPQGTYVGGFVGNNEALISNCVSMGKPIHGYSPVGTFAGANREDGSIDNAYYWYYSYNLDQSQHCSGIMNRVKCESEEDLNYFKGDVSEREPFTSWNFIGVWYEVSNNFPNLVFELTCSDKEGIVCLSNEYCLGGEFIGASDTTRCCTGSRCIPHATTNCDNNGVAIPGEESCDGKDLNGESCITRGFTSGDLKCTSECLFDTSLCKGERIKECTLSDECWLKSDTHCNASCVCETEYIPNGNGGCVKNEATTKAKCGSADGKTFVVSGPVEAKQKVLDTGACVDGNIGPTTESNIKINGKDLTWDCQGTDKTIECEADYTTNPDVIEGGCNEDIDGETFDDDSDWIFTRISTNLCENGIEEENYIKNKEKLEYSWTCGEDQCKIYLKAEGGGDCYDMDKDGSCDLNDDYEKLVFTLKDNPPAKCSTYDAEVIEEIACPAPLPFFSWINLIIAAGAIALIYFLINEKKKK